jgi:hypothetical protein
LRFSRGGCHVVMVAEGEGCCNCRQQSKAWLGWGWDGWLCEVHVPKPPVFAVVATLWTKAWLRRTTCLTLPWRCEHVATCSGRLFFLEQQSIGWWHLKSSVACLFFLSSFCFEASLQLKRWFRCCLAGHGN